MRPENQRMQSYLKANGIDARVKFIWKGSLKNSWRLYNPAQQWSEALAEQLNFLGFTNLWGAPVGKYEGNGGMFSVFVRREEPTVFRVLNPSQSDLKQEAQEIYNNDENEFNS